MFHLTTNVILILIVSVLVFIAMGVISSMYKNKQMLKEGDKVDIVPLNFDNYEAYRSNSQIVSNLNKNKLINKFGRTKNSEANEELEKIFNDAKNPWGITPTIFRGMRTLLFIFGFGAAALAYILFGATKTSIYIAILTGVAWWYPLYYYKAIGKEREDEWDKMYEFIWVIKNSSLLYDAKKVCLETREYIKEHYPNQIEIITGFDDFYEHWDEDEIPEFIEKFYNFPIPKEIYTILFNMNLTGTSPDQSLDNLRSFALNKHNGRIQKVLSGVPSKATVGTLPFLMLSVVIALLIPMVMSLIKLM